MKLRKGPSIPCAWKCVYEKVESTSGVHCEKDFLLDNHGKKYFQGIQLLLKMVCICELVLLMLQYMNICINIML